MSGRMKGHGKQRKPPVVEKMASNTLIIFTLETYSYHFSLPNKLTAVKVVTPIDKKRQAF